MRIERAKFRLVTDDESNYEGVSIDFSELGGLSESQLSRIGTIEDLINFFGRDKMMLKVVKK